MRAELLRAVARPTDTPCGSDPDDNGERAGNKPLSVLQRLRPSSHPTLRNVFVLS